MQYPILYHVLGKLDPEQLLQNIKMSNTEHILWEDWKLIEIDSQIILNYITSKFENLELFKNQLYISQGTNCNFHLDRFEYFHIMHRILIPLSENYEYQWIQNGEIKTYVPSAGEVILFNNMVPHRFCSHDNQVRKVVFFDLVSKELKKYIPILNADYSDYNHELNAKMTETV